MLYGGSTQTLRVHVGTCLINAVASKGVLTDLQFLPFILFYRRYLRKMLMKRERRYFEFFQ